MADMEKVVTVSLKSLWESLVGTDEEREFNLPGQNHLRHSKEDDEDYYDLITADGIVCMDGEKCNVLGDDGRYIELLQVDGNSTFKLTKPEFKMATFTTRRKNNEHNTRRTA